jgi:hypothetical protein
MPAPGSGILNLKPLKPGQHIAGSGKKKGIPNPATIYSALLGLRPTPSMNSELRAFLGSDYVKQKYLTINHVIAMKQVQKAVREGNLDSAKEIYDRIFGKVKETMEVYQKDLRIDIDDEPKEMIE